jgi:hypothetical protein
MMFLQYESSPTVFRCHKCADSRQWGMTLEEGTEGPRSHRNTRFKALGGIRAQDVIYKSRWPNKIGISRNAGHEIYDDASKQNGDKQR